MKTPGLIFRNLWFYRKPYLAVLAGATISIAVLTGALAVGDSVRYSIKKLTDVRLGKTRYVVQSRDHLFRGSLAASFSKEIHEDAAPLLFTEGIAINTDNEKRINRAEVIGIDIQFLRFWEGRFPFPGEDEAILSRNTASRLELKPGDEVLLRIRKQGNAPRNAPFSAEKTTSVSLRLRVKAIADDDFGGLFSLKNNQSSPFNIFIGIKQLNAALDLENKANILLVAGENLTEVLISNPDSLISRIWQPSDAGLRFRKAGGSDQAEITSERIFMDEKVSDAVTSSIPGCTGVLTYLANTLNSGSGSTPYSFVTAASENFLHRHPADNEIIINQWLAEDLHLKTGDSLFMNYFVIGQHNSLKEKSTRFIVMSVIPMNDPLCDQSLMPDFPGMTEAGNCRDWETATPINFKKIRDKDEKYWKDHRGTPKAFISLETGQKLWKNMFGNYTAFRFSADERQLKEFETRIMQKLKPSENGLLFIHTYDEGRMSAENSTDFGRLFLGLGFFIILAGLLLMAMIFSVQTYTRLTETGLLSALGFRKRKVIRILFAEASVIAVLAGILGSLAGIGYTRLMLAGLNTLWQDSVRTSAIFMHVDFTTLLAGSIAGILMALLVLLFVLYRDLGKPLTELLRGPRVRSYFRRNKSWGSTGKFPGFFRLVLKNSGLNLKRTIGAIVLLAIGTFTIIITGANRRTFPDELQERKSGTGGFLFWAEGTIPFLYDLNTPDGKKQFDLEHDTIFNDTRFLQLYSTDGDDASCLNLNRVSQPAILGISVSYPDAVSAFSFLALDPSIDPAHPWKALDRQLSDGVIPGFADQTVIRWGLGKSLGDTLVYIDESGKPLRIKLMGGLDNSVFQGNILISDSLFRIHYPSSGGSKVLLVDGPFSKRKAIGDELEYVFRDYGMVATPASRRLDEFNSVQNTYLSVFMLLGGLGVIIGTFGLGFLLIRNILDRQNELAIYRAIGFRKNYILWLLTAEHMLILVSGMVIGIIAGLAAIFPALISPVSQIPVVFLSSILSLIFITGFLWIIFPVRAAMKKDIIAVLRKEN
jgi:putative ABC transport system permease protein